MDKQKTVSIARKVESLAIGYIGVFFFSWGTSYFQEQLYYQVPRILIPVFDIFGNVGLAIGMLILGGGLIYYGFTKWKIAAEKKNLYWILAVIGLAIGVALANITFNPNKSAETTEEIYGQAVTANPDDFIMEDILWSFSGGQRATQEKFVTELVQYNLEIDEREIDPNEIVVENREIIVSFAYEDAEGDKMGEFRLTADSNKGFTTGELLYKIHNQVVEHLEKLDYHFFEGLIDNGTHEQYPAIPFYYLNLGS